MKLPSMIKGWFNPDINPESLLASYYSTGKSKYLSLLVEQFNLSLFHYLVSQSNKETAEDVLQSTWLKVIKTKNNAKGHTNVKGWLFTIARNALIDELRRQQKWQWQGVHEGLVASNTLEKQLESYDRLASFNQALEQLPFHQREVFILQQEGFSLMEIAQLTHEEFEAVKSRLRYARTNIKKILGPKL